MLSEELAGPDVVLPANELGDEKAHLTIREEGVDLIKSPRETEFLDLKPASRAGLVGHPSLCNLPQLRAGALGSEPPRQMAGA
jgi:hypothetical protein